MKNIKFLTLAIGFLTCSISQSNGLKFILNGVTYNSIPGTKPEFDDSEGNFIFKMMLWKWNIPHGSNLVYGLQLNCECHDLLDHQKAKYVLNWTRYKNHSGKWDKDKTGTHSGNFYKFTKEGKETEGSWKFNNETAESVYNIYSKISIDLQDEDQKSNDSLKS